MRLLTILLLLSTSALAEDRKPAIDFTQPLVGVDGKILFQGGEDCLPQAADKPPLLPGKTCSKSDLSLSDVSVGALETVLEHDRNEDPKKRFVRDQLARKVYKNSGVALTTEEISMIKDRVGRAYGPSIVGASWPMLDPSLGGK